MICPLCSTFNDPALSPSGRLPPQDWHPIWCVGCRAVLCLDHTAPGGLRPPTDDDWDAWLEDPKLAAVLARITRQPEGDPDAR